MRQATLCFLVRGHPPVEILLGLKKRGFGQGKYNGFGGKVEAGESVEAAAIREVQEEIGARVSAAHLRPVGYLEFVFPAQPAWDQVVHVFLTWAWHGTPTESAEMKPAWVPVAAIPYPQMWADDVHWLPRVLADECVRGRFVFKPDGESIESLDVVPWVR